MEKKEERPWCMITEMDQYLFGQGTHYEIYKKLGAHLTEYEGEKVCILQSGRLMQKACGWLANLTAGAVTDIG